MSDGVRPHERARTHAREAWVDDQRNGMDVMYRWSTFGKLGFNATASQVVTVSLGQVSLRNESCVDAGFHIAQLAAAAIPASAVEEV